MEREGPSPSPLYLLSATAATVYTNRRRRRQMPQQARKLEGALRTKWRRSVERTGGGPRPLRPPLKKERAREGDPRLRPPDRGRRGEKEWNCLRRGGRRREREESWEGGRPRRERKRGEGRGRSVGRPKGARAMLLALSPLFLLLFFFGHAVIQSSRESWEGRRRRTRRRGLSEKEKEVSGT